MKYCIGLTGSVASGKSTVAAMFAKLGTDVISADHIARALVMRDQPALEEIVSHFGKSVLLPDGELNRRYLRELIVRNTSERLWLENLLHPLIRQHIRQEINHCTSPYCVIEIPLLTGKADYPYLNRVLLVTADPEQQVKRLEARDHCSREHAIALLKTSEAVEDQRRTIADDIIHNNGSSEDLQEKVSQLHTRYLQTAPID